MTRLRSALLTLGLASVPAVAHADSLQVVPDEGAVPRELDHTVEIALVGGTAMITVERTLTNEGSGKADIVLHFELPLDGVMTGLTINKGTAEAQLFDELNGFIYVPGVGRRRKKTVRYTIEVPIDPTDGKVRLFLPEAETGGNFATPIVRFGGGVIAAQANPGWDPYELPNPTPSSGQVQWGAADLPQSTPWRVEVDAPHRLAEVVSGAKVVFLLDRSRSQGDKGVARQLRVMSKWAMEMSDAKFQVIAYARESDALFPGFVDGGKLQALQADDERLTLQHGTNLDEAVSVGASVLQPGAPTFLVVLGDGELPVRIEPRRLLSLLAGLPGETTLHVVETSGRQESGPFEIRIDDDRLAPLASTHNGVPVRFFLPEDRGDADEVVKNLLRPSRIDGLTATVNGELSGEDMGTVASLGEKHRAVLEGCSGSVPTSMGARGKVWAETWEKDGVRTEAANRRAALFTRCKLSDEELKILAEREQVLTTKTALAANKRTTTVVPPTDYGIEPQLGSGGGGTGTGRGSAGIDADELSNDAMVAAFGPAVDECIKAYVGPATVANISLETNYDEVLDASAEGGDATTRLCLVDAVWSAEPKQGFDSVRAFGWLVVDLPENIVEEEEGESDGGDDLAAGEDGPPDLGYGPGGCRVHAPRSILPLFVLFALPALRRRRR